MRALVKTTLYLDEAEYKRLKVIGRRKGRAPAALVREAIAEYTRREEVRVSPRSVGAGRSGKGDIGDRAEELLEGLGDDR